jgi:hypothetical protein
MDLSMKVADATAPDDLRPSSIKEYPSVIQRAEKLRRLARSHAHGILLRIQAIEDEILHTIENETYEVHMGKRSPVIHYKKIFKSSTSRERELRRRLADNTEYQDLKSNYHEWNERCAEWVSYTARLRRELRLLETDYIIYGGSA